MPTDAVADEYSSGALIAQANGSGQTTYYYRDPATLAADLTVDGNGDLTTAYPTSSGVVLTQTDAVGDTTQNVTNAVNQVWCQVSAAEYLAGVRCPSSVPSGPPAPSAADPNAGAAISYYNLLDQLTATTDALGNTTTYSYTSGVSGVPNGVMYCSVDPVDYQASVSCPAYGATHVTGTSTSTYDAAGDQTSQTDADGNTTTSTFSAPGLPGLVSSSTDADGTTTTNTYNTDGQLTKKVASFSGYSATTLYAFDTNGRKYCEVDQYEASLGVTCPSSAPSTPPSPSSDPYLGATITTYDSDGRAIQKTNPLGGITYTAYDDAGEPFCAVAPFEAAASVTCPSSPPSSAPTIGSDPYLGATITTYDSSERTVQVTNPLGGITLTSYNSAGNVAETQVESNSSTNDPTVTTQNGYDAVGRVTSTTVGAATTLQGYDPNGNAFCSVSANNFSKGSTTYSGSGGVTVASIISGGSLSVTSTSGFSSSGTVSVVTSAGVDALSYSSETSTTFAGLAQLSGLGSDLVASNAVVANPSVFQCPAWQPQWGANSPSPQQLYSATPTFWQANGVTVSFANDNGNNLQTTTPDMATSINAIDGDGRNYCNSDATNVGAWISAHPTGSYPYICPSTPPSSPPSLGSNPGYTTTIFDAAGRTSSTTDQVGDTTSYTYDPNGNKLLTTDPRGEVTTDCYYYENSTGQCAASASSTGGAAGDLYSQTTPATTADPSGEVTTHTYFAGDVANTTTTPAGTSTDGYDAMGDLTSATYSGTAAGYQIPTNLSYTYFVDGTRHTMTDATGTTTYSEDANGDVTGQTLAPASGSGLASKATSYSYFTTGAVSGVTYPGYTGYSSPQATYTYDAMGNMASVTDWLGNTIDFGHDGDGNVISQLNAVSTSNPSGTSGTSYSYDGADLNTGATSTMASSCTLTQGFSGSTGSRNADGQVTYDSEQTTSGCPVQVYNYQRHYSYDAASRVIYQGTATQGSSANNFGYDASGDPTTMSNHDSSANFDTYSQTFDNAGEVTGQTPVSGSLGSTSSYTYDTLGDQSQTTTGSSTSTDGYNQIGQMATSSSTNPTLYSYSGAGLQAATVTQSGTGWSAGSVISASNPMNAVSCASTTFCVAVGNNGRESSYNGTSWSSTTTIDTGHTLKGVSCPTSTFCMAVDNAGNALQYNGSTWTSSNIDSTRAILGVSCPTTSLCAAVDGSGYAQIFSAGSWLSSASNIDSTRSINGVSCSGATFCVAVDSVGQALTYNGTSWSAATATGDTNALKAVSCTTSAYCVAVDRVGNELTYRGSTWGSANNIAGSNVLDAISCPTTVSCQAADQSGNVFAYNGISWSSATNIDSTNSLTGVSCLSSFFCEVVDNRTSAGYGFALTASLSQSTWDTNTSLSALLSDGTNDYINGPTGEPVEQVNITSSPPANNPEFLTYTPTDSSWLITNSAGQEITFTRYDAFGTPALGASASPFGYAGQYVNQATGLYDMRSRSYQPQYGTFTTRDSLFSATDQAFVYAGNDPINSSDPLGQAPVTYPFWAGYAEPGGIGNYEMLFACTNYMSCVADWYLSLKPAYWFYQGIILWFRMRVNGIARPWYWYSHTESGHYQWHGFINTFPYASIVFVDLVLVFEAFSPDQFIATGTQQWHMVKL